MAGTDEGGWPGLTSLESLLDFKITEVVSPNQQDPNYIVTTAIGQSLGERAETRNFSFDAAPPEREITKAILDTYKEMISQPEYTKFDFY